MEIVAGQVVVAGGTHWVDGVKMWTDRVDQYDLAGDTWSVRSSLPFAVADVASCVHDGSMTLLGGSAHGRAVDSVVRDRDGSWGVVEEWSLPTALAYASACSHAGSVYLLGGQRIPGDLSSTSDSVWRRDRGSDDWQECHPTPPPLRAHSAVTVAADRILVAGGCTGDRLGVVNLAAVLAYDPVADSWASVATLPVPVRAAGAVAFGQGAFVLGGFTSEFSPAVSIVGRGFGATFASGLPLGLADARYVSTDDTVVAVTGEDGARSRFPGTLIADRRALDPASETVVRTSNEP